jgi:hypothetical protein
VVDEENDAEGRDDVVEVIAAVELPEHQEFQEQPEEERGGEREDQRRQEIAGDGVERDREIGAEHVLDAVRQVDEVHHAEHQGEPGRDQEQQHAELKPVEDLDHEQGGGHWPKQ